MPTLSLILVTRNDRRFVRDCLDSLRAQDTPVHELIVVDRGSEDGTPQLIEAVDAAAHVLAGVGPRDGVAVATGDIVVLATARACYAPDALRRAVNRLRDGRPTTVAGRPTSIGTTNFGRAAAAVVVALPVPSVAPVAWMRSNGDAGAVEFDDTIRGWQYAPEDVGRLARESFEAGVAAARLPLSRMPAPAAISGLLVVATIAGARGRGWRRVLVPVLHLMACVGLALQAGRAAGVAPHRALLALEVGQWAGGLGLLRGLLRPTGSA